MAVDGYVWMHRAIYNIPFKEEKKYLCKFVEYFEIKLEKLQSLGMEVYIVWDGDKHPMKEKTNKEKFQ